MKIINYTILMMLVIAIHGYPQGIKDSGENPVLLDEIVKNIASYRSKTITLRLRMKHFDKVFEKLTFYDSKNHDIEFDISDRFLKKRIAPDMLNLHEGMDYNVTFKVQNVGNLGQIIGELIGFKPIILEALPERSGK